MFSASIARVQPPRVQWDTGEIPEGCAGRHVKRIVEPIITNPNFERIPLRVHLQLTSGGLLCRLMSILSKLVVSKGGSPLVQQYTTVPRFGTSLAHRSTIVHYSVLSRHLIGPPNRKDPQPMEGWPQSKPSGADSAPNYSAAPNYGAEGCPAVRFVVHDPHQVLGWCRSDTIIRWFGVRSAPSQRLVQRMGETRDRKESGH